jgi:hypothetical protein
MKAFLIIVGIVFGLIVVAHLMRITVEPEMAKDPWFWALTALAGALSLWAWVLVWRSRRA